MLKLGQAGVTVKDLISQLRGWSNSATHFDHLEHGVCYRFTDADLVETLQETIPLGELSHPTYQYWVGVQAPPLISTAFFATARLSQVSCWLPSSRHD